MQSRLGSAPIGMVGGEEPISRAIWHSKGLLRLVSNVPLPGRSCNSTGWRGWSRRTKRNCNTLSQWTVQEQVFGYFSAVNQVSVHLFIGTMPFGGVGLFGMGHNFGKYDFDRLTHAKGT